MYARVRECEFSRRVLQDDQSSGRAGSSVRRRTIFFRKPSSDACPDRSTARGMELSVVGRKCVVEMVAGEEGRNVFSIN